VDGDELDPLAAVFPTHVGVNRAGFVGRARPGCIPHTRGGEPA
jgi:hypothetical protein